MISSVKSELRTKYKKIQYQFSQRNKASQEITKRLIDSPSYKNSQNTLLFSSTSNEVNTAELIQDTLCKNKTVFLPYVKNIEIGRISTIEELVNKERGIYVPNIKAKKAIWKTLELIILPALAFDLQGYRLGHGNGWYDRFLSQISEEVCIIGLAFESQIVDVIPVDKHDKKVNQIITEQRLIYCQ